MAPTAGANERRLSVHVAGVNVGALRQQHLHNLVVAVHRRSAQRGVARLRLETAQEVPINPVRTQQQVTSRWQYHSVATIPQWRPPTTRPPGPGPLPRAPGLLQQPTITVCDHPAGRQRRKYPGTQTRRSLLIVEKPPKNDAHTGSTNNVRCRPPRWMPQLPTGSSSCPHFQQLMPMPAPSSHSAHAGEGGRRATALNATTATTVTPTDSGRPVPSYSACTSSATSTIPWTPWPAAARRRCTPAASDFLAAATNAMM